MKNALLGLIACMALLGVSQASPAWATSYIIDIGAGGPDGGWGCTTCSGGPTDSDVAPGTVVTLTNYLESGPLQLTLGPGTYSITNAATTGYYSAWNYEGYPTSGNWAWSFLIGADNGNGTATILNDGYILGAADTQAGVAALTGITTWDWQTELSGTSTAGFVDTLTLTATTTLDFFIDDYYLPDNGGGVALDIEPTSATPLPAALPLFVTGLGAMSLLGWRRKRKNAAAIAA